MSISQMSNDSMEVDLRSLTPPPERGSSTKRSVDSIDDLTPRKRPRISFWPSKKSDLVRPEGNLESEAGTLKNLTVGYRSPPIDVRVISKDVRAKYLKLVVMDHSDERTVKAFGSVIQQFKNIEVNKLYKMQSFNVQYGFQDSPDEIVLQANSAMDLIDRDGFPEVIFNFKGLGELSSLADNTTVDVFGIITSIDPVTQTTKGILKRELILNDEAKTDTPVIFWKNNVEICDSLKEFSPIVLRFAIKKTFDGKAALIVNWKTQVLDASTHSKSQDLMKWFREETAAEGIEME